MATEKRTYAARKESGRAIVSVTMSDDTRALLASLALRLGLSRSALIDLAIRELAKRQKKDSEGG